MSERVRLTAAEIEALCVDGLSKLPGLETIQYARIRPYKGDKSWNWRPTPAADPWSLQARRQ
jgi:hypothetical protein